MTASITIHNPEAPATTPQLSYLTSLLKEHTDHALAPKIRFAIQNDAVRKGQASTWISELKTTPAQVAAAPVVKIEAPVPLSEAPEYGYYDQDGTIYCYDAFKVGGSSYHNVKLMKLVTATVAKWNDETKTYDYLPKGKWVYAGKTYQAKAKLAGATKMTLDEAIAKGKTVGFCIVCGATLTDPKSVAAGIGPICAKKF